MTSQFVRLISPAVTLSYREHLKLSDPVLLSSHMKTVESVGAESLLTVILGFAVERMNVLGNRSSDEPHSHHDAHKQTGAAPLREETR